MLKIAIGMTCHYGTQGNRSVTAAEVRKMRADTEHFLGGMVQPISPGSPGPGL